jgi:hypothetical protein
MQTDDESGYQIGDIVVWKSNEKGGRHLVEGFDGDKVILRPLDKQTWSPQSKWFTKEKA